MMWHASVAVAGILAALWLPWPFAILLGILLIAFWGDTVVPIAAGLIMDLAYGTPLAMLHGFAYLYTTIFVLLALVAFALRSRMIE